MSTTMSTGNGRLRDLLDEPMPHNIEAEQAVLGSILLDNGTIPTLLRMLTADSFLRDSHRKIFAAIQDLSGAGQPVDPITLCAELTIRKQIEQPDQGELTHDYIAELFDNTPTAANAEYYAKIVREKWRQRQIQQLGSDLIRTSHAARATTETVLDDAEQAIATLRHAASIQKRLPQRETIRKLIDDHPRLHEPVIDGLLRERETLNIISVSKIGKSWLLYSLLLCIVVGEKWLGRFATRQGRVLIVDNELHRPTIANRIKTAAEAMQIPADDWLDSIDVWPLRGALQDIFSIGRELEKIEGPYAFIGIDAKYRAIPADASENDNAAETAFYNEVDRLAEITGNAIGMVHHSSKGSQSEKRITDVGAGAGAQSRAADAHLILREHEEDDAVVLDAAVRSFKPIEPMGLRWKFPLWVPDDDLDPERLKGKLTRGEEKQGDLDAEADVTILDVCESWKTRREIRKATGFGDVRIDRCIARLLRANNLQQGSEDRPRHPASEVFKRRAI